MTVPLNQCPSYRFVVTFDLLPAYQQTIITSSVLSVEINNKASSIRLVLYQPLNDDGIYDAINTIIKSSNNIIITRDSATVSDHYSTCLVSNHMLEYNYAHSTLLTHLLDFTFLNHKVIDIS